MISAKFGVRFAAVSTVVAALLLGSTSGALAVNSEPDSAPLSASPTESAAATLSPSAIDDSDAGPVATPGAVPDSTATLAPEPTPDVSAPAQAESPAPTLAPESAPATSTLSSAAPDSTPDVAKAQAAGDFQVQAVPADADPNLPCITNGAYLLSSAGRVRTATVRGTTFDVPDTQVNLWGDLTQDPANEMNGLGMSADGSLVMAYVRLPIAADGSPTVKLYYLDSRKAWRYTGDDYTSPYVSFFVAGAVNPLDGNYYFGGFGNRISPQAEFFLYKYDVATGVVSFVGRDNSFTVQGDAGNTGDMTFDRSGNLYVITTAGANSGNPTVETRLIRANTLAAATGSLTPPLTSYSPTSFTPQRAGAHGVAFSADGGLIIAATDASSANGETKYNPATGAVLANRQASTAAPARNFSTDMANCYGPATITVKKNVVGRAASADQFLLTLDQVNPTLTSNYATATTTGSATGIQADYIGPFPALGGTEYRISESMAPGSVNTLSTYANSLACTDERGSAVALQSNGNLIVPTRADAAIECILTNTPLTADVTVSKVVQDPTGGNPQPGQGWALGAATTATAGSATQAPSATSQTTSASGQVSWNVSFAGLSSRATVRISETQQPGYTFISGQCTVTRTSGISTVPVTSATGTDITGVGPTDRIACELVNRDVRPRVTLTKQVDNTFGGSSTASDWTLGATGPTTISGRTGEAAVTAATVPPGSYTLSESGTPTGYGAGAWSCTGGTVSGSTVSVATGANVVCSITNSSRPGAAVWTKTAQDGTTLLGGSEWTITGPGFTSANNVVRDCVAAPCTGVDQDPRAGGFRLANLRWGQYSAVETKAPAGFIADRTFSVTIAAANAGTVVDLGAQRNSQQTVPSIPLTGGLGQDHFLIGGAVLIAFALALYTARRARLRRNR